MNTIVAERLQAAHRGAQTRAIGGEPPKAPMTPPAAALGPEDHGFLDKRELAEHLKITVRTVENWQKRGVLPFIKVGKIVLFHWPDVVEHLRSNFRVCRSGR
jgi:excisionase family DNA binding protein